jgi:predicted permease
MDDLFASAPIGRVALSVNGRAEIASGLFATGNYFHALGVTARLGRTLLPDDDRAGAAPAAVVSSRYWQSRFGGSPDVVGSIVRVNNVAVTIVGVITAGFNGIEQPSAEPPDVTVPLALEPQIYLQPSTLQPSLLGAPNFWWLHVTGRLKPGATVAQAQAHFAGVFQHAARTGFDGFVSALPPDERSRSYLQDRHNVPELLLDSGSRGTYDPDDNDVRAMTILTAAVALVLLIVCANVATLMLSRSTARAQEFSIRAALGASRVQLARLMLAETVMLAAVGGALGLALAPAWQRVIPGVSGSTFPLDWRVLAFAAGLTAFTGAITAIVPALRATRFDVYMQLRNAGSGRTRTRAGKVLVAAQVAISMVLLVGAGLFVRTVQNLRHVDVGFNAEGVLLFRISPALNRYTVARQRALYQQLAERLRAIGGVKSVAWSNNSLMSGRRFQTGFFVQGRTAGGGERPTIAQVTVSSAFFETMEIPIVDGRGFTVAVTRPSIREALINETAVRTFFRGESPVGRRFGASVEDNAANQIVGVVRDAKYNDVRGAAVPTVYRSMEPTPSGTATFAVRTTGNPLTALPAIRAALAQVDPDIPMMNVTTQAQEIEERFIREKTYAQTYAMFGTIATLSAALGLFGLMSYSVARRTAEIGIRMALGARRREVVSLVLRESLWLAGLGVAAGIVGAVAGGGLISHLLFGVAAVDPSTLIWCAALLVATSAAAGYVPARRASRVEPISALRAE